MQHHKHVIQLSEHVKNKIKYYHPPPSYSRSSNELNLSDHTFEDNDSFVSSPPQTRRKRSYTFTTYHIEPSFTTEPLFTDKKTDFSNKQAPQKQNVCQECIRRDNLLQNQHQNLLHAYEENQRLAEELRASTTLNQQYQEENLKLQNQLTKLNSHLEEYKRNFSQLKQKLILERVNANLPNQNNHDDQIKRIRHELQVYKEVMAAKRQEEQKSAAHFPHLRWI